MGLNLIQYIDPNDIKAKAGLVFDSLDASETTRKDYKVRIGLFLSSITELGLNRNSFLDFKRYLEKRADYTVSTKNKYLTSARVFLKELNRQGVLPADITQNIRTFAQIKKHKREGLNEKEIMTLVQKIRELPDTPRNTRLRALFCLLTFQGLRQIEIIRLDVKDVNLTDKTAFIQGKGRDDKELIHLAPETVRALKNHIRLNRAGSGALFKSIRNRKEERLSTMTIKRELGSLLKSLGIEKTVHGFRHFYITALLSVLEVRDVRKFSRHRSLEMLICYDDEVDIKHKTGDVFKCFEGLRIM